MRRRIRARAARRGRTGPVRTVRCRSAGAAAGLRSGRFPRFQPTSRRIHGRMALSDLFRTKSVDVLSREAGGEGHAHGLKRTLTGLDLMMLGIGAVIGTGIFAAIGTATAGNADRPGAGPAIVLSFVITAIACVFSALCYAEFASMIPISGSAYTYSYATLGEMIAWIIGWDLIIEYAVGNIAVAISWASYFNDVLNHTIGWTMPAWVFTDLRTALKTPEILAAAPHLFGVPIVLNLPAVLIVALVT